MKIKQIRVEKLFGLEKNDFDIECFPNENITILYAFNGTGKTTLLRLIDAVSKNDKTALAFFLFKRIELIFDNGKTVAIEKENPKGADISYLIDGKEASDSEIEELKNDFAVKTIFANKTVNTEQFSLMPKPIGNSKVRDNYFEVGYKPIYFACKNIKDLLGVNKHLEEINKLIEIINNDFELEFKKLVYDKEKGLKAKLTSKYDSSAEPLSMFQLSSGEQNLIVLFHKLLFETKPHSIVLLDEPESSLHIDWQKNLLGTIMQICKDKKLQVIVATHSPDVIDEYFGLQSPMISGRYKDDE